MAIKRKSSAAAKKKAARSDRPRKASPARKAAKPARAPAARPRPAAKAKKAGSIKSKGAPVKAAKPAKAVKPAAPLKGAKGSVPAGQAVKGGKPVPAAAARGAKAAVPDKGTKIVGRPAKPAGRKPAEVRPIGMLPPNLIARSNARSASPAPTPRAVPRPAPTKPAATQGVQTVTEQDIKDFETRLLSERQRILKEMGHLESTVFKVNQRDSSGDLSGYAFHMADAGTDAMEREKAFLFASAEGRTLMEIDEALRRLYQSEYGMCESCGQPIGLARLQAIPQARLCVTCKEKEERTSRGAP